MYQNTEKGHGFTHFLLKTQKPIKNDINLTLKRPKIKEKQQKIKVQFLDESEFSVPVCTSQFGQPHFEVTIWQIETSNDFS